MADGVCHWFSNIFTQIERKERTLMGLKLKEMSNEKLIQLVEFYRRNPVTNLLGRKDFELRFDEMFHSGEDFSLILIDVNGLHNVNKRQGYSAGDDLLRRAFSYIEYNCLGELFHLGGDEGVILTKVVNASCAPTNDFCMATVSNKDFESPTQMFDNCDRLLNASKEEFYKTTHRDRRA